MALPICSRALALSLPELPVPLGWTAKLKEVQTVTTTLNFNRVTSPYCHNGKEHVWWYAELDIFFFFLTELDIFFF